MKFLLSPDGGKLTTNGNQNLKTKMFGCALNVLAASNAANLNNNGNLNNNSVSNTNHVVPITTAEKNPRGQ